MLVAPSGALAQYGGNNGYSQPLPRPVAPCTCAQNQAQQPEPYAVPRTMDYGYRTPPRSEPRQALGRTTAPYATPGYYEPPVLWQGLYAGIHAGYGSGSVNGNSPLQGSADSSGGLGGFHVGHNWQSGNIVYGVESDLSLSWAAGASTPTSGGNMSNSTGWLSTLRGRFGYSFGSVMAYATAGLALTRNDFTLTQLGSTLHKDDILVGYAVGAGLEMKLAPKISARVEAMHYGFGGKTLPTSAGLATYDVDQTVVRAGLTFHLN